MISEDFVRLRTKSCSTLLLTFPVGVDFQFPSASDFQLLRCRLTWAKIKVTKNLIK